MTPDPFVEEMSDGLCLSDADGTILYMNPAARQLLGLAAGAEKGLRSCDIVCGRLHEEGRALCCALECELRDPASNARGVSFAGRHGPRRDAVWSDGMMRLRENWRRLHVRCERVDGPVWGLPPAERHFLLIKDEGRA